MVLFAGVCSLLAFVVRTRPVARRKAKVLYIRIDNADGGRAKIKVASNAESGGDRYLQATPKKDRRCENRASVHGARTKGPDGIWYATVRSPPARGGLSAVVSHDEPLSASMEVIFWR